MYLPLYTHLPSPLSLHCRHPNQLRLQADRHPILVSSSPSPFHCRSDSITTIVASLCPSRLELRS
ncbi:hypothetical protein AKJ16_DCAP04946 [Drosera capensis]